MRVGRVIGATDRWAGEVVARPVHYQEVFATLYRNLGIDPAATQLTDPTGRPQHPLDKGEPIRELIWVRPGYCRTAAGASAPV